MNIKKALDKIPGARRIYSLYRHLESFPCPEQNESLSQQCQKILINQYTMARLNDVKLHTRIADAGFRCYSQFEEDGIILYVLSTIGFRTKKVVEICCGDGRECMATNLILNHGFRGFLFDGNENNIMSAARFFGGKKRLPPHSAIPEKSMDHQRKRQQSAHRKRCCGRNRPPVPGYGW